MTWLFFIIGAIALSPLVVRAFVRADPNRIAILVTRLAGVALIALGLLLSMRGLLSFGVPMITGGAVALWRGLATRRATGSTENRAPQSSSVMSVEEALDVLGLEPGATDDEIRAAHKALMQRVHPDHGGSDWMAAKLNAARETLLRRR